MEKEKQTLSICVPAFDKSLVTAIHVRECMNSSVMPDEIIVVNDGGDDALKGMLQKLEKKTKIIYAKILEDIGFNHDGACNLGVWLSKGEVLGFEDTDNIPHKDFYKSALEVLSSREDIGKVTGKRRWDVSVEDLEKPVSEWNITGTRGTHQNSCLMKRDVYLKLKGRDEKFCGRYGWADYDWKRRLLGKAKISMAQIGYFYFVVDGQSDISRRMHPTNYHHLRRNTKHKHLHDKTGILNFEFSYCEL